MLSHCFPFESLHRFLITRLGNKAFQNYALMIDSAPKMVPLAVDLHKHLVEVPAPTAELQPPDAAPPDLGCEHRAEPIPPVAHRFMADIDAAFVQQILHLSERKWEPNVKHHRKADDLGARFEVLEGEAFGYARTLSTALTRLKRSFSDRTFEVGISTSLGVSHEMLRSITVIHEWGIKPIAHEALQ